MYIGDNRALEAVLPQGRFCFRAGSMLIHEGDSVLGGSAGGYARSGLCPAAKTDRMIMMMMMTVMLNN